MKRRLLTITMTALALALTFTLGWWAKAVIQERTSTETSSETTQAEQAEVISFKTGKNYTFGVSVLREYSPVTVNFFDGIITSLNTGTINIGDEIYRVDNQAVFAAQGDEPFYRELQEGTEGEDVTQLQTFLSVQGYYRGTANGRFASSTTHAVKQWQKKHHLEATGIIELGRIVALPGLPTSVLFSKDARKGMPASTQEPLFTVPSSQPKFILRLTPTQAGLIPLGSQVTLQYQGHTWNARVADATPSENDDQTELHLTTPDGDPLVCGNECGILPGAKTFSITSTITVEEPTEGPALPAAAVTARADGTSFVIINGKERAVEVLASGSGMLILSGVEIGEKADIPRGRSTSSRNKTPGTASESENSSTHTDASDAPIEASNEPSSDEGDK